MVEKGLEPDFSRDVLAELAALRGPAPPSGAGIRDLRERLWVSIDNDDSRDLDQLTVSERSPGGATRIFVAVADVDALVAKGSAIDVHARTNTTSRLHGGGDLPDAAREALDGPDVAERGRGPPRRRRRHGGGRRRDSAAVCEIYRAAVRNHAKLAYDAVSVGLDGGSRSRESAGDPGRRRAAPRSRTRSRRRCAPGGTRKGALDLETIEPRAVFEDDTVVDLAVQKKNRARQLIEDFMIAANGATARFLAEKGVAVAAPRRPLARALAADRGRRGRDRRPAAGRARRRALEAFLVRRRRADPLRFPDLSLVIVKLMGAGEYVVERPGQTAVGHFGLAVRDYTHSTAPNRRYPDLITQRLLKAALAGEPAAVRDGGASRARRALHGAGGRRRQGRASGAQVGRRAASRAADRPALRRES